MSQGVVFCFLYQQEGRLLWDRNVLPVGADSARRSRSWSQRDDLRALATQRRRGCWLRDTAAKACCLLSRWLLFSKIRLSSTSSMIDQLCAR